MSFILDALRKAERDRNVGQAPSLQDVARAPETVPEMRHSRALPHGLLIGALLLLIALGLFFALRSRAPQPASSETRPAGHVTATVRGPAPVYAAPSEPSPSAVAATDPAPIDDGEPAIEDGATLATLDDLTGSKTSEPPAAETEAAPAEIRRDDFVVRPDPAPVARAPALEPEPIAAAPRSLSALEAPLPGEPRSATNSMANQGASSARPLDSMPASYQAEFPALSVEVHVWDYEPSKRFLLIGGRRYREGDTLAAGPHVTTITQDGIELDYQGERVLYPLNR